MTGCDLSAEGMTAWINSYFAACNTGDADAIAAYFEPDGVHYFPPGMYAGPFRGARTIGERWHTAVANGGSYWTVDQVITDPATRGPSSSGPTSSARRASCCAATSGTSSASAG